MDQLREQLMQSYFNQMSEGMQNMTPERMQQMKDMLNELNQMLEQRERGEEPDFEGFMERHGDFFPGNPQTPRRAARADGAVDGADAAAHELDDARAARAAPGRSPSSLLEDMDLRWQVDQLSRNLQQAFPNLPWERSQNFRGDNPLSIGEMPGLLDTLGDLDDLENLMRRRRSRASSPRSTSTGRASCSATTRRASLDRLRELTTHARGGRAHRAARGPARAHAPRASAPSATRRSPISTASC